MIRWATKLLLNGLIDHPNVQALHVRLEVDPAVYKVLMREAAGRSESGGQRADLPVGEDQAALSELLL